MFRVGELTVYPAYGVGRIEKIETQEIHGSNQQYYYIRILDNNMTIMVPIQKAENRGLREITPPENIPKILEILSKKDESISKKKLESLTWNRRYKIYMDKIRTGSPFLIAEVLRDLIMLKSTKELSFGERKVFDIARNLLIQEMSISQNTDKEEIKEKLQSIFTSYSSSNP